VYILCGTVQIITVGTNRYPSLDLKGQCMYIRRKESEPDQIQGERIMPSADVIIYNARIFTSDESNPSAEAVAVKGNRILYVGTNEGTESYKDKSTRLIDGQGHTLTPGFIDTHVHLLWGSIWMGNAQLQEVRTKADLKNILTEFF